MMVEHIFGKTAKKEAFEESVEDYKQRMVREARKYGNKRLGDSHIGAALET